VATHVALILIQIGAGYVAVRETSGGAAVVIVATLIATTANTVRELVRELTGPQSKQGREIARAHHLLGFLVDRFPQLARKLTATLTCAPADRAAQQATFEHQVLTAAATLIPDTNVRAALIWRTNGTLTADASRVGWKDSPPLPSTTSPEGAALCATLDTVPPPALVWVEDLKEERSVRAMSFAFSDSCQSLVACPIRCATGVIGFLHVEADETVFDERAADVICSLTQLIGAARSGADLVPGGGDAR
jgi:hypothetical protein